MGTPLISIRFAKRYTVARLPKIIKTDNATAFIINNIAICSITNLYSYSGGQFQHYISLPISYKNLDYIALANTNAETARCVFAAPLKNNAITVVNLGGITTEFKTNIITIGEI